MNSLLSREVDDVNNFWNWRGHYVGYRSVDCLFGRDGRQIGYFAEGDEVYGCAGNYIGEVRSGNRLITNLSKKAWTRKSVSAHAFKTSPGHRDISSKEMLTGFEDFPAPSERNRLINA
jgi:hypothetical protein